MGRPDDLHELDDAPEAMAVLDALVRSVPMNLRLYLLSRTQPAIARLKGSAGGSAAFPLPVFGMFMT